MTPYEAVLFILFVLQFAAILILYHNQKIMVGLLDDFRMILNRERSKGE